MVTYVIITKILCLKYTGLMLLINIATMISGVVVMAISIMKQERKFNIGDLILSLVAGMLVVS